MDTNKYDEMKFNEGKEGAVNHSYNEVTFHQPGEATLIPKLVFNRGTLTLSASYEVPSPTGPHDPPTPGPSSGYMALHVKKEEKSEYHSPDVRAVIDSGKTWLQFKPG